ncbi:MAG: efflux RND transporter periplasmic adaptor subunit, partial [Proteobacteria bacterium]|nr:efflux RND transporter periplasmic adaptor subunit [Pseudomonadota bacterium]
MPKAAIKALMTIIVLLAAVAAAASIIMTRPEPEKYQPAEAVSAIRAITVTPQSMTLSVQSEGTVAPRTVTELIPEVSGRIQWRSPNLVVGGYFTKGERLLSIDSADYEAKAGLARARLIRAEADLEHSAYELKRLQTLVKDQLISQSSLETAIRTNKIAEAAYIEAEINLSQAERNLDRTVLTAPFEGLVRAERINVGQFVREGNSVATLYASDEVEVRLPMANEQLAFLELPASVRGAISVDEAPPITLTATFAGQPYQWQGYLARTESEIDAQSRMVTAVARVIQ